MTKKSSFTYANQEYSLDALLVHSPQAPLIQITSHQIDVLPENQVVFQGDVPKVRYPVVLKYGTEFIPFLGIETLRKARPNKIDVRLITKHTLKKCIAIPTPSIQRSEQIESKPFDKQIVRETRQYHRPSHDTPQYRTQREDNRPKPDNIVHFTGRRSFGKSPRS